MSSVFISYRRSDSSSATGRIADRLKSHFGSDKIFYDVDTVPFGIDFQKYVSDRLDKTDVFLVIVGDQWLQATDSDGKRRIDNPADNVHIEVSSALARENVPVIPVLVGSASGPPRKEELPKGIQDLSVRNAIILRSDTTFGGQIERLIEYIESLGGATRNAEPPAITQLVVGKDKVKMQIKTLENADENSVRFSLSTANDISWWKGIKVFDKRGMISLLSTQDDDHGPKQSPLINISDFGNEIKIEFHKAVTFGRHARVDTKKLPTSQLRGFEVSFTWLTDSQ